MALYTVKFTTRKIVTRYDHRGKLISETEMEVPVTLTMLPPSTARQYAGCDNFQMIEEEAVYDQHAAAPQKRSWSHSDKPRAERATKPKADPRASLQHAAATGDLSAAINGVK